MNLPLREGAEMAFTSARQEIIARMGFREDMLGKFLTASTAVLGGAMILAKPMIALLVPVFGFGICLIVVQHNAAIASLCCWTREGIAVRHWGNSRRLQAMHRTSLRTRAAAQCVIFLMPSLVALGYALPEAFAKASVAMSGLWWLGVVCTVLATTAQYCCLQCVKRLNERCGYERARLRASRIDGSRGDGDGIPDVLPRTN